MGKAIGDRELEDPAKTTIIPSAQGEGEVGTQ